MTSAEGTSTARRDRSRYRSDWGRALLAVGVVAGLVGLAVVNVFVQSTWQGVTDGVYWVEAPGGLTAESVDPASPST